MNNKPTGTSLSGHQNATKKHRNRVERSPARDGAMFLRDLGLGAHFFNMVISEGTKNLRNV